MRAAAVLLLGGALACLPPPAPGGTQDAGRAGRDGRDDPIGSGQVYVIDAIHMTPPGGGLDLDGDGDADDAINRAWDSLRSAFDNTLQGDLASGESMLAVELCGLDLPYRGDDPAVSLRWYPGDDADTDPTNNYCAEPGCARIVPDLDALVDDQSRFRSEPVPLADHRAAAALSGIWVIDPGGFNLRLRELRLHVQLAADLAELRAGQLAGLSRARDLNHTLMPVCEWLPTLCLNPSTPEEMSAAAFMALVGEQPELDLDGDGLESFEIDNRAVVLRCHDGDGRVIEGPGCLEDPGMVDGYGLSFDLHGIPGELVYPLP